MHDSFLHYSLLSFLEASTACLMLSSVRKEVVHQQHGGDGWHVGMLGRLWVRFVEMGGRSGYLVLEGRRV